MINSNFNFLLISIVNLSFKNQCCRFGITDVNLSNSANIGTNTAYTGNRDYDEISFTIVSIVLRRSSHFSDAVVLSSKRSVVSNSLLLLLYQLCNDSQ
jgi:hypothetical protein